MRARIVGMEIHGQIQNGVVVPEGALSLPDGTRVTITVKMKKYAVSNMSPEEQARYLEALEQLDDVASENPDDAFGGADHDQALYGDRA